MNCWQSVHGFGIFCCWFWAGTGVLREELIFVPFTNFWSIAFFSIPTMANTDPSMWPRKSVFSPEVKIVPQQQSTRLLSIGNYGKERQSPHVWSHDITEKDNMERTLLNRATFFTPFSSRDLENRTFCSHLFLNGDYTRDESTEPFCNALGSGKTEPIHHRRDDYLCQWQSDAEFT